MTELSPRLGFTIPKDDGSDAAVLDDLLRALGLDIENKAPGITALTTAARTALTGAAMFAGRAVYDTGDGYLYLGNGTVWVRIAKLDTSGHLPMAGKKVTGLADGTAATDAATKGQLDAAMPIGAVTAYAGTTAPAGWALCNGAAVSRTTYAGLFAVVGTTYGAGDGTTTFNLPDLRGRVPAGLDNLGGSDAGRLDWANTPGTAGGTQTHTLNLSELPSHSHGGGSTGDDTPDHGHQVPVDRGGSEPGAGGTGGWLWHDRGVAGITSWGATSRHRHPIPNEGGGAAHNNMQPTLLLGYIIKTT